LLPIVLPSWQATIVTRDRSGISVRKMAARGRSRTACPGLPGQPGQRWYRQQPPSSRWSTALLPASRRAAGLASRRPAALAQAALNREPFGTSAPARRMAGSAPNQAGRRSSAGSGQNGDGVSGGPVLVMSQAGRHRRGRLDCVPLAVGLDPARPALLWSRRRHAGPPLAGRQPVGGGTGQPGSPSAGRRAGARAAAMVDSSDADRLTRSAQCFPTSPKR